jgi:hypothetical protein
MAKQGIKYARAARDRINEAHSPSTSQSKPATVIVADGRLLGVGGVVDVQQCVAMTARGRRCRNPIEYGQSAVWDVHGRYRLDWSAEDATHLRKLCRCAVHIFDRAGGRALPSPAVPLRTEGVSSSTRFVSRMVRAPVTLRASGRAHRARPRRVTAHDRAQNRRFAAVCTSR